jgi:hypothetical protein
MTAPPNWAQGHLAAANRGETRPRGTRHGPFGKNLEPETCHPIDADISLT